MSEQEKRDIRDKILNGIALAFERLVEQKKREDGELVFSENGKIVRVRARDL
ncbi:MAG: hypothetical protein LUD76_04560 [Alistipes sp.]|nr:hypothetical protein [Alistipes sp.]MCD8172722.1 hypothetical protein [Alistipes sp.]